jgi:hypothetical protein
MTPNRYGLELELSPRAMGQRLKSLTEMYWSSGLAQHRLEPIELEHQELPVRAADKGLPHACGAVRKVCCEVR